MEKLSREKQRQKDECKVKLQPNVHKKVSRANQREKEESKVKLQQNVHKKVSRANQRQLQEQKLELTELEGALIAKNIIFQKIYQLPKSRWTALKDKVVNVPINEDSILNTLDTSRTPQGAGLIGVALKRKNE